MKAQPVFFAVIRPQRGLRGRHVSVGGLPSGLACFHINVGNAGVGGRQKVADLLAAIGLPEHLNGHLRAERGLLIEDDQPGHKPVEHRAQGIAVELHSHRQKQGIGAGGPFPQALGTLEARAKLVHILASIRIKLAREPALGFESFVHQQVLADDALRGHGKAVLVAHTVQHKRHFKHAGLAG